MSYIWPKCGKKTMIKKITNGKYYLICTACKVRRGPLPLTEKLKKNQ